MQEGVEEGAVVLSVLAIPGARIEPGELGAYSLTSDEGLFRLDARTGNVLATRHIDRESICRQVCTCSRRIRLTNGNDRITINGTILYYTSSRLSRVQCIASQLISLMS